MPGEPERHEHVGIGHLKVQKNGEVIVEKGDLMIERTTGENIKVEGKEVVNIGDYLYWTKDCTFTLQ